MNILPMTKEYASVVADWKYSAPYSVYSFKNNPETIDELLNGDYYIALGEAGSMLGYFCFGKSARIPTDASGAYVDGLLDIGLGMNPDLCGKGLGLGFLKAGIEFAREAFHAARIRLTVAVFNQRAIRVYENAGFHRMTTIKHQISQHDFYVMECGK